MFRSPRIAASHGAIQRDDRIPTMVDGALTRRLVKVGLSPLLLTGALLPARAVASSWTREPIPRLPTVFSGALVAVSCPSRGWCMAVGAGIFERWSGGRWTVQA